MKKANISPTVQLFLNIYKNAECNSDLHYSYTTQIGKFKNAFIVTKINQKSIQNGENLH